MLVFATTAIRELYKIMLIHFMV